MTDSGASQGQSAAELISTKIAALGDWRGETLSRMRRLIKEVDESAFKALVHEALVLNASVRSKASKKAKS